jgi:hypothetical protein
MPMDDALLARPRRRRRRPVPARRRRRAVWFPTVIYADVTVGWASGVGFAVAGAEMPTLRQGVALTDAWAAPDNFAPLAAAVSFLGRFTADSGALSTQRSRARNA